MLQLTCHLKPLMDDPRVGFTHVCLFIAILQWYETRKSQPVLYIRRMEIMRLAKIRSEKTFYTALRELGDWGFIEFDGRRKMGKRVVLRRPVFK